MIVVGVRQPAAALEQARRRQALFPARLLERLGFGLVAIRRVEQLVAQALDLGRALGARERLRPRSDLLLDTLLLFDSGEREPERVLRRGLEAPLAAPVEVHQRRMEVD